MNTFYLLAIVNIMWKIDQVSCTIDVNLSELEYLAAHMDPFECRRLVAALHYITFDLPQSMAGAVRKVDEDISCLDHLLHWNNSPTEGKGKTHEELEHRLRQINRNDLANWLGKTVFKKLGEDLHNTLDEPFDELKESMTEFQYPTIIEQIEESNEENPWLPIDTLLMVILVNLLACLLFLIFAIAIHKIVMYKLAYKKKQMQNSSGIRLKKMHSEEEDKLLDSDTMSN